MCPEVLLEHVRCDVRLPHLLHPHGAAQHGRPGRTGDNPARPVEVLRSKGHHRRMPDTVQRAT